MAAKYSAFSTGRWQLAISGIIIIGIAIALAAHAPAIGAAGAPPPTFTKDIARIFQDKCQSCHRPDSMAPMSLLTYEEARPYMRAIAQRVGTRQIPPCHIDKTVG